MKKIIGILLSLLLQQQIYAQTPVKPAVLYGTIKKEALLNAPYSEWYLTNHDTYQPNVSFVTAIKKMNTKNITIDIFLGTWCGDSKREVPRFLKLLESISFPDQQVKIICLGGDSLVKQSPQHEEAGKGIFRVPTFIVYKDGVEMSRINEFPAFSLEKDLCAILRAEDYTPNYRSFATVKKWLEDGSLLEKNYSIHGLAAQLKTSVAKESELNSLGRLLFEQGRKEEGLRLLQINTLLYPESSAANLSAGEAWLKTGDTKNAVKALEKAIEQNKEPQRLKEILKLLYEAKGVKE